VVDFWPGDSVSKAFQLQRKFNAPGQSPPLCSEYYTGWMTHWGERMARTPTDRMVNTLRQILAYGNNRGSVVLYMAHGGTNFGLWAGGGVGGCRLGCGQVGVQVRAAGAAFCACCNSLA
jgi:beta-galactosidase